MRFLLRSGVWLHLLVFSLSCQKAEEIPEIGFNLLDPYPDNYIKVDSFTSRGTTFKEVTIHISQIYGQLNEIQKEKVSHILYETIIGIEERENFIPLDQQTIKLGFRAAGEVILIRFRYKLKDKNTTEYTRYFEYTIP